jgi:hypothetical protein
MLVQPAPGKDSLLIDKKALPVFRAQDNSGLTTVQECVNKRVKDLKHIMRLHKMVMTFRKE